MTSQTGEFSAEEMLALADENEREGIGDREEQMINYALRIASRVTEEVIAKALFDEQQGYAYPREDKDRVWLYQKEIFLTRARAIIQALKGEKI